jgi:hypothetical protein
MAGQKEPVTQTKNKAIKVTRVTKGHWIDYLSPFNSGWIDYLSPFNSGCTVQSDLHNYQIKGTSI